MPPNASRPQAAAQHLVDQARSWFVEQFLTDLEALRDQALEALHTLVGQPAERGVAQQRQDALREMTQNGDRWPERVRQAIRAWPERGAGAATGSSLSVLSQGDGQYELVDDDTIQRTILTSRLSLALLDQATWEFADLRARVTQPLGQSDLDAEDIFRPQVLARCLLWGWTESDLPLSLWRALEAPMHKACAGHAQRCYQSTNRWIVENGGLQEIDLRAFIRRADGGGPASAAAPAPQAPAAEAPPETTHAAPAPSSGLAVAGGVMGGLAMAGAVPSGAPGAALPGGGAAEAVGEASASGPGGERSPGGLQGLGAALGALITRAWPASLSARGAAGRAGRGASTGAAGGASEGGAGAEAFGGWAGPGGEGGGPGSTGGGRSGGGLGGIVLPARWAAAAAAHLTPGQAQAMGEETRMMTRQPDPASMPGELVVQHLSDLVERQVPGFRDGGEKAGKAPSQRLVRAMAQVQQRLEQQATQPMDQADPVGPMVREFAEQTRALKQAAESPNERATIELVALMFQNILTEERIPPTIRIWFARLQMPTLRVALAEPEFFTSTEHPARRLIDRMGGCVMGFEGGGQVIGAPLEAEIRRIVQVIEAFPDTGRRVFKTVLKEFERFLEKYFREQNEASRAGVSLAQQIEQRETLAIQYTIELRKMLADVPAPDEVRDFMFHVWADVLATHAVRQGPQSDDVRRARDLALDLISLSASKTMVAEREEMVRKVPGVLAGLRHGMALAGLDRERQTQVVETLTETLATAFSARAPSLGADQLEQLKHRLATIEDLLPDEGLDLDDSWVLDEASHQQEGLEIVADGGSMPAPAQIKMAAELELGSGFQLQYKGRRDFVRLAWQGMHRQLSLFVTTQGLCLLFQKARLAAYLQAGLLVPTEDEPLTASASRRAMHQLQAHPERLVQ
ncbi:DUF1631 family protein [Ideonella livida]|uniref:DUF1631 domain-containing protein n=1 Tax=Ideonella livida TaxID=2707176 RepID=A0A7C9PGT0_9BURK|nr:DUF1631 family protein [Ideonella livida]NDY91131.1 DUF1631 domain-containing protein [Ideonella livida]